MSEKIYIADKELGNVEREMIATGLLDNAIIMERTDVIHVDGKRYEMKDVRAKVGDVIISKIDDIEGGFSKGNTFTVTGGCEEGDLHNTVFTDNNGFEKRAFHSNEDYAVLVLQKNKSKLAVLKDELDLLKEKVRTLESQVDSNEKDIKTWVEDYENFKEERGMDNRERERLFDITVELSNSMRMIGGIVQNEGEAGYYELQEWNDRVNRLTSELNKLKEDTNRFFGF